MARQMLGSLLVAVAIVVVTIVVVTAKLGPNAEEDHHGGSDKTEQEDHSGKGGG
jgi:hypothetical protein